MSGGGRAAADVLINIAKRLGVPGTMEKPFDLPTLLTQIEALVGKPATAQVGGGCRANQASKAWAGRSAGRGAGRSQVEWRVICVPSPLERSAASRISMTWWASSPLAR